MSQLKCSHCGGTGLAIDGAQLRRRRIAQDLTLQEVAARMGISFQYLSDLEKGKRNWDGELLRAFNKAVPS